MIKTLKCVLLGTWDTIKDPELVKIVLGLTVVPPLRETLRAGKEQPSWLIRKMRKNPPRKSSTPLSHRKGHVVNHGKVTPLPVVKKSTLVEFVVQEHHAKKLHWDLRIWINGRDCSFALPKCSLPGKGKRFLAVKQPDHTLAYYDFKGKIPEGQYGAGKVKILHRGKCEVHPGENGFWVRFWDKGIAGDYSFVPVKDSTTDYFMVRKKEVVLQPVKRMSFKEKEVSDEVWKDGKWIAELKRDGAHNHIRVDERGKIYITSHRTSVDGTVIEVGDKVPRIRDNCGKLPGKTCITVEIYHPKRGSSFVGGTLNSLPPRAREAQKRFGNLRAMILDIRSYDGKDLRSLDYGSKRALMRTISRITRGVLEVPPSNKTNKRPFFQRVVKQGHEGVVLKRLDQPVRYTNDDPKVNPESSDWFKLKRFKTWDKVVVGTYPAEEGSKYDGNAIGGLLYGDVLGGVPLGRVGTGISDTQRREWLKYPKRIVGKVVEIEAHAEYPTGALREPRMKRIRNDKDANNLNDITRFEPEKDLEERVAGMGYEGEEASRVKHAMKASKGWRKK